jgi:mannose-6-phosphate isomerase-like protein (cupin superfamily)
MDVRRVVTGHDENGKAVFVSDERVPPAAPTVLAGSEFHELWGGDATPKFPDAGTEPSYTTYFPSIGGFRFKFFSLPPAGQDLPPDLDVAAALTELETLLPGMASYLEPDDPGMHTTATIDFEVILEGEIELELDDGAKVRLRPGDTVVQNGTRHRWSNPGSDTARLVVFMCGAHHDRVK